MRRFSPQLVVLSALVAVAGCVSAVDGPSPTDPLSVTTTTLIPVSTTTVTLEQGLAAYQECLSGQGVAAGEIQLDGRGRPRMAQALADLDFSDRTVLEALETCAPELSSGALDLSADPMLRDLIQTGLEDLADCMRRQGVADYPDPVPGFGGLGSPYPLDRIPWSDPDLPTAVSVCSSRLGASSPG